MSRMNQKTRMALGLCKYCEKPRGEGTIVCEEHAQESSRKIVEKQHERRARGCCRYCDELPLEGATLCQKHRDAKAEREKARVEGRQVRGLCRLCDEKQAPNKKLCQKHLDIARGHERRIRTKLREERGTEGTCHRCSEPSLPGKTRCAKHAEQDKVYNRRYQNKEMWKEYKEGKGRFARCAGHARATGRVWTLTKEQFETLVAMPCEYCGFHHRSGGKGLDRLDNALGYIPGNVVSCCFQCNVARGDNFTYTQMKDFVGPAIRAAKFSVMSHDQINALPAWTSLASLEFAAGGSL